MSASVPGKVEKALAIGAAVGFVIVIVAARQQPERPARCNGSMRQLGARCCADGQELDGDKCIGAPASCPAPLERTDMGCVAPDRKVSIAGGTLRLGPSDWEAHDVAPREVHVAPFSLDAFEAIEARWSQCVEAGRCAKIDLRDEPGRAASGMTKDEAAAYCAWRGGRLPSADELAFASAGAQGRRYPWGDTGAVCRRVAWGLHEGPCAKDGKGPEIAGEHPDGASAEGAYDLAGNVAEWTSDGTVSGGSWMDASASALRAWQRRQEDPSTRSPAIGVRCAYAAR